MNFESWLQTATQGLPLHRLEMIRNELTTHYLDAVDDYLLQGLSADNARTIALRELGDARAVSDGLRSVHIHRHDYWRAMLIAGLPSACVLVALPIIGNSANRDSAFIVLLYLILIVISACITLWATMHSLRMVSMIAYMGEEADLPLSLIRLGLWIVVPMTIIATLTSPTHAVFMALINAPVITYAPRTDLNNLGVILMSIGASFGIMLTAIGWILFTNKLNHLPRPISILPLLRSQILFFGIALIILSTGAILRDNRLTAIGTAISLIFGILTFALFIILFYQMAKNTPPSRASYA